MSIPKYDEIQIPALKILSDGTPRKRIEIEEPLSIHFKLTEEERNQMYDSGNGPVFMDRVQWALSYLNMAGLVSKPKRGIYQINEEGRKILENPASIKQYIGNKLLTREPNKKKSTNKKIESSEKIENDLTPEESLFVSYQGIRKSVYREIIDTILSKNPREFEKLVVQLLQRMGYGGEIKKLWTGNPILK